MFLAVDIYVAVKDYEAQCPDEMSFNCGDEMEVLSMSNIGWWQVRYHFFSTTTFLNYNITSLTIDHFVLDAMKRLVCVQHQV